MSDRRPRIKPAESAADLAEVERLFLAYAKSLDFDLCFQGFEAELAALPGCYALPAGGLWLARDAGAAVGVVGLRPLQWPAVCEMKRLYVEPSGRGCGLGWRLAETAIDAARARGYQAMRLDTIGDTMAAAQAIYEALGFVEIPPYYDNPLPGVRYMELDLTEPG